MKKSILSVWVAALSLAATGVQAADSINVQSNDIPRNGKIDARFEFDGFGCQGQNQSPQLSWQNLPAGTQSIAISAYDPDAPTGSGFWHWMEVNLPGNMQSLSANAGSKDGKQLPNGAIQLRNDYGYAGFGGVCPPKGDLPHRYIFTIYALKQPLNLNADTPPALAGFMLNSNAIAKGTLSGYYVR